MTTTMREFLMKPAAALIVLALSACNMDSVLQVSDPDIINPADVKSAAGADAVRLGALARLNAATSGGEGMFLLGGLFADEWVNGDSYIARQEIDQRVITNENSFLTGANRVMHRARISATLAIDLLAEYAPNTPAYQVAEMYFARAYVVNMMAEHYCSGIVFSKIVDGKEEYGTQVTTQEAFQDALKDVDAGLALITGSTANDLKVKYALQVTRGRILLNLNRPAEALNAVAAVPTSYAYNMLHSATTYWNEFWDFNNSARRYSVASNEGTNGMDFATANDPRVPVCIGNDTKCKAIGVTVNQRDDKTSPLYVQMLWPAKESSVSIIKGVDARMIEAEAQLRAANPAATLATLNAARTTVTGLAPLTLQTAASAQLAQLMRERAFWEFGRGYRVGNMRRMITQWQMPAASVFPVGAWHKGGNYGADMNFPVPQAEQNNPNLPSGNQTCLNRNP